MTPHYREEGEITVEEGKTVRLPCNASHCFDGGFEIYVKEEERGIEQSCEGYYKKNLGRCDARVKYSLTEIDQ